MTQLLNTMVFLVFTICGVSLLPWLHSIASGYEQDLDRQTWRASYAHV